MLLPANAGMEMGDAFISLSLYKIQYKEYSSKVTVNKMLGIMQVILNITNDKSLPHFWFIKLLYAGSSHNWLFLYIGRFCPAKDANEYC